MEEHSDDLKGVHEGDDVTLVNDVGTEFTAECMERTKEHAAPETGEIRETTIWTFGIGSNMVHATIMDGLKSSPDDPDFPKHTALYVPRTEENLGYITEVKQ
jgi:hypothetical protein